MNSEHSPQDHAEAIHQIASQFNHWFNTTVAPSGLGIPVVGEIIAILYSRLRVHMYPGEADQLMRRVVELCEELIASGQLAFIMNGEQVAFRPRESFATKEEKDFFVEASWGLTDADFDALLKSDD